jgi:hypothetical protein
MAQKIPWIGTGRKMNKLRADAVGFIGTAEAVITDLGETK